MLMIVCGLPGSGKTIAARNIAECIDAVLLRTDVIRRELIASPDYTDEERQIIYDEMFDRAVALLQQGRKVVLDATFAQARHRREARRVAEAVGARFAIVAVTCAETVVEQRILARSGDESEADFQDYLVYRASFEPISEAHFQIDNSGTLADLERQVRKIVTALQ